MLLIPQPIHWSKVRCSVKIKYRITWVHTPSLQKTFQTRHHKPRKICRDWEDDNLSIKQDNKQSAVTKSLQMKKNQNSPLLSLMMVFDKLTFENH